MDPLISVPSVAVRYPCGTAVDALSRRAEREELARLWRHFMPRLAVRPEGREELTRTKGADLNGTERATGSASHILGDGRG